MESDVALIGFGEAGSTFAHAWRGAIGSVRVYDRKTDDAATAPAKREEYARTGVRGCDNAGEALAEARAALSLVTADQALPAARAGAAHLASGALWLDMNSVAPDTKRAAREVIEASGGRYVDVAIMAPVNPARLDVPLLVSGRYAGEAQAALGAIGFTRVRIVPGEIGAASAIKMIRSVMVKGIEALTAECVLAAEVAGVRDEVLNSLGAEWSAKADYNLDRMMRHGLRRAAEMEEVAKTLDALGTGSVMTAGTIERQRAIGSLGLQPADGLDAKLAAIIGMKRMRAA